MAGSSASSDEGFAEEGLNGVSTVNHTVNDSFPSQRQVDSFDAINVVVRVRPNAARVVQGKNRPGQIDDLFPAEGQIQVTDPQSGTLRAFTFDVIFEPEASQEQVFEFSRLKKFIDMSLEGFASTVFAYGQTGSGKTHTMTGDLNADPPVVGIVQFAFAYLFEQIDNRKNSVTYTVTASFLEVYNEHVHDLLNPTPKSLQVRWNKERGFYAENLFKVECEDLSDLEGVLREGLKNRSVRSHEMNLASSRSHSLLTISLSSETRDPEDPNSFIRREGRLCLVDLAGSEKVKKTQSKGETFHEANSINKSLLVLGNCIHALSSQRPGHIPYRDSVLTKLLADSLSGSGMTLMIACVSCHSSDASETISTLRYASRAKNVKTKPLVRMDPRELQILSLRREVRLMKMENSFLRQQLGLGASSLPAEAGAMLTQYMKDNEELRVQNERLLQEREHLIRYQEESDRTIRRLERDLAGNSGNLTNKSQAQGAQGNKVSASMDTGKKVAGNNVERRPSIVTGWPESDLEVRGTSMGTIKSTTGPPGRR